jgi:hypothetical protein
MSIHRCPHDTEHPYTRIANKALQDPRVPLKAKGLLFTILSLPTPWTLRVEHIAKLCPDGSRGVKSAFRALKPLGYATLIINRDSQGRVQGKTWHVFEDPDLAHSTPEVPLTDRHETALSVDNRQSGFPTVGKPAYVLNNQGEINKEGADISAGEEEKEQPVTCVSADTPPPPHIAESPQARQKSIPKQQHETKRATSPRKGNWDKNTQAETPQRVIEYTMAELKAAREIRPQLDAQTAVVERLERENPVTYARLYTAAKAECLARSNGHEAFVCTPDIKLTIWEVWHREKSNGGWREEGPSPGEEVGVSLAAAD